MLRSFEERECAEELLFAIGEKRRFLSRRASAQTLADFAIRRLGCDDQTNRAYAEVLIDAIVHGAGDESLLESVRTDLSANSADFSLEELRAVMMGGGDLSRRLAPVGSSHSPVHRSA